MRLGRSRVAAHSASPPCWRAIWRTSVRPRPVPDGGLLAGNAEERREDALALALGDARRRDR